MPQALSLRPWVVGLELKPVAFSRLKLSLGANALHVCMYVCVYVCVCMYANDLYYGSVRLIVLLVWLR